MKKITCVLLALLLVLGLTGCGAKSTSNMMYSMDSAAAQEAPMEMASGSANALRSEGSTQSGTLPENRKWIITVDMNVETEDLELLLSALEGSLAPLNGYVQDQSIYNGSTYSSRRYRNANLTIRIPVEHVEQFTSQVQGFANVVSNNLRREDVTLTYVATESKVTALKTEETRLLELLAQAETMTDLLEIEGRLSDVRYELEHYATQLRTLDNQIDYATISLFAEEVKQYTPVEEPTLWERITRGFSDSLDGLGESLQDLLVFIIVSIPYLLVYGTAAVVIFLILRKVVRRKHQKKQNTNTDQT